MDTIKRRLILLKKFEKRFVGDNWRYGLSWSQWRGEEDNGIKDWLSIEFNNLFSEIEDLNNIITKH